MGDTTSDKELEERLLDLMAEVCEDDAVGEHRDEDLFELGLLDSMAAIELLVGIEEEFGVSIAPTELPRDAMNTVNKILARLAERL
ncbi:D-alanine--poly(phosphoribitol) ligase subunit DltC [Olsenella sp. HMSC062G07]|uniref:D-alanine--poly(phosphoribitol) ligase subunit DltC n=1 Tax=Olsenella sp. HMSC062G07 TaxID=1739330 RepID=UPI0008A30649|nr:D-alanine--poly(phosphoribitol) ligase subunit DltC [Olsenella sp. HMSC062G07]OFK22342.1 D-alanine--poly(phosphoribitol) ligase subunit 2 [Olsenella sp. HMSC062G07]